jgi:hypothetical protein
MLKFAALQGPAGQLLLRSSRTGMGHRIPRVLASSAPIVGVPSMNTTGSAYSAFSTNEPSTYKEDVQFETILPPVLPQVSPPQPKKEMHPKNVFTRLWERYSPKGQQHRIHTAEALFQAASRQASDPYVPTYLSCPLLLLLLFFNVQFSLLMDSPLRATYLLSTFDYFVFSTLSPLLYSTLIYYSSLSYILYTLQSLVWTG